MNDNRDFANQLPLRILTLFWHFLTLHFQNITLPSDCFDKSVRLATLHVLEERAQLPSLKMAN